MYVVSGKIPSLLWNGRRNRDEKNLEHNSKFQQMIRKLLVLLLCLTAATATAKKPKSSASKKAESSAEKPKESDYDKLFKEKHTVADGMFRLHDVKGKLYFEIPDSLFGREMLLGSTISEVSDNAAATTGSKSDYPLHVGVTETGTAYNGIIRSAVGIGTLLSEGIGDTIRVSLTGDPLEEIKSAKRILKTLGLRKGGIEVVSCPTCGRTQIDLIGLANQVETLVQGYDLDIKVAVMGCVVNGPGEARSADIGIAGGIGEGLLIKKGEIIKKVPEHELLSVLREELLKMQEMQK